MNLPFRNAFDTISVTTPNGTVGYAFDTASRRTSMSVTGTGTWTYSFDAGDRLTQIVNPSSETSQFFYDAANRQTGQTNGDSSTVVTTFDNANRPRSSTRTAPERRLPTTSTPTMEPPMSAHGPTPTGRSSAWGMTRATS